MSRLRPVQEGARPPYSAEERAAALAIYEEHGPAEAERQTGIKRATISQWAKRAGVTVTHADKTRAATEAAQAAFARRREEMRLKLLVRADELLDRINDRHVEFVGKDGRREEIERATAQATRDYATSVGILIDKLRLELGEVTDRTESVSKSEFDREVEELVGKMKKKAASGQRAR